MSIQARQIFVNLPVKDLQKSIAFFTEVGFQFNPQFTDDKAACLVIGENLFAMLLTQPFFQEFTKKEIPDTARYAQVIVAVSADSRGQVDEIVNKAVAAGGVASKEPTDHGFMYEWGFQDLEGHHWEFNYMDLSAITQG